MIPNNKCLYIITKFRRVIFIIFALTFCYWESYSYTPLHYNFRYKDLLSAFYQLENFRKSKSLFDYLTYNPNFADSIIPILIKRNDPDHLRLAISFSLSHNINSTVRLHLFNAINNFKNDQNKSYINSDSVQLSNHRLKNLSTFIENIKNRDQFYKTTDVEKNIKNNNLQFVNDSINSSLFWKEILKENTWPSYFYFEPIKANETGLFSMQLNLNTFLIHQIHIDPVTAHRTRMFLLNDFAKNKVTFGELLNYEINYIRFFPAELNGYGKLPGLSTYFGAKTIFAELYCLARFLLETEATIKIILNSNRSKTIYQAKVFLAMKSILSFYGVSENQISFSVQKISFPNSKFSYIINSENYIYRIEKHGVAKTNTNVW